METLHIESIRPGYIAAVCSTIVIMIVLCGYLVICTIMVTSEQIYTHTTTAFMQLHVFTTESYNIFTCAHLFWLIHIKQVEHLDQRLKA